MFEHERSLVKRLEGKSFVLIGINSDQDREETKKKSEKEQITWRSFWNGGSTRGPISTTWNVHGWPTTYVLDHKGVIRYKGVRGEAMDKAVDTLLQELDVKLSSPAAEGKP